MDEVYKDGMDENRKEKFDNVINTGLDFKRVDVHALGNAIYHMNLYNNPFYSCDFIIIIDEKVGNAHPTNYSQI